MIVASRNATIINDTGRRAEVSPFAPEYEYFRKVLTVDAAIRCEHLFIGKTYLVMVRNTLSAPYMGHHSLPSLVIREAIVDTRHAPKIHFKSNEEEDHLARFKEDDLRTPLNCISCFLSSEPSNQVLNEHDKVLLLTPD